MEELKLRQVRQWAQVFNAYIVEGQRAEIDEARYKRHVFESGTVYFERAQFG